VYVVYAAAYGPVFTYAAKAATMTFSTPVYIDSTIPAQTTLTGVSMLLDSGGNIDAAYVDNSSGTSKLKCAIFAPTASLPISVSGIGTIPSGLITSPSYPSAANQYLISYYNTYPTPKIYELYERYTWSDINLHIVSTVTTIDSSSSDVGLGGVLLLQGNTLYSTYYDTANSVLKFAVGNRVPLNNQTGYSFTTSTITTAGSSNFCCRLISDQSTNTFYVIFSDSSGSGALKLAKSLDLGATW
jgi:hypothetical protein